MKKILIALLSLMTIPALSAESGFKTGNDFAADIQDTRTRLVWLGYIAGIADALNWHRNICPPEGVTRGQYFDIVAQYVDMHPEKRHQHLLLLTQTALTEAFPCRDSTR